MDETLTVEDVKAKVLEQIKKWLDNPGRAQALTIEITDIPLSPQEGGGVARIFELHQKVMAGAARMRLTEASRILPAGAMPAGGPGIRNG